MVESAWMNLNPTYMCTVSQCFALFFKLVVYHYTSSHCKHFQDLSNVLASSIALLVTCDLNNKLKHSDWFKEYLELSVSKDITGQKAYQDDPPPLSDRSSTVSQHTGHETKHITSIDRNVALDTILCKNNESLFPVPKWNEPYDGINVIIPIDMNNLPYTFLYGKSEESLTKV